MRNGGAARGGARSPKGYAVTHIGRFLREIGYMAGVSAAMLAFAAACLAGGGAITALLLWIGGPAGLVIGFAAMLASLCVYLLWIVWDVTR